MSDSDIKYKFLYSDLGIISLLTSPIFFMFLILTKNLFLSIIVFAVVFLFVLLLFKLTDNLGLKRHRNIINSEGFQELTLKGFKVEKVNDYIGITGDYNGYICDIYYNWQTFVKSKIGKAYVINVYFIPPKPLHETHNANHGFIMAMKKKYSVSRWSFKSYDFDWQEGAIVMNNRLGFKNPPFEKIQESIKMAVEILKKENLKPICREDLTLIRNNFPYQSAPQILLYHGEKL